MLENHKTFEANQANSLAKNFFKHKSSNHLEVNGSIQEPQIIISAATGNYFKFTSYIIDNTRQRNEENEFREKRNNEEEKKEEFRDSFRASKEKNLIPYPRIEMSIVNSRFNIPSTETIILTPNSINATIKKIGDKFIFGRHVATSNMASSMMASLPTFLSSTSLNNRPNDYDFTDETIGSRQFEISYSKEKNKFYVVDNKKGTGLFVKIKQSVVVDHDMIISFCASHMILQVEPECKYKNIL